MSDDFSKYSRQMLLSDFGIEAQNSLKKSKLVCVGVGGVGSVALPLLVGAGLGRIEIIDADKASISNLHRQTIYSESDVGLAKVDVAKEKMRALNASVNIITHKILIKETSEMLALLRDADICIDASDSFNTRFLVAEACSKANVNLISASAENWVSQVVCFGKNFSMGDFLKDESAAAERSQGLPIFGPAAALSGVLAAGIAIRVLAGIEDFRAGRFSRFSFKENKFLNTNF